MESVKLRTEPDDYACMEVMATCNSKDGCIVCPLWLRLPFANLHMLFLRA